MAWCTTLGSLNNGTRVVRVQEQQDTQSTIDACTTPILVSQPEYQALTAQSELWGITPEQGSQIALSIMLIWAIALVFRLLRQAILQTDSERNET